MNIKKKKNQQSFHNTLEDIIDFPPSRSNGRGIENHKMNRKPNLAKKATIIHE